MDFRNAFDYFIEDCEVKGLREKTMQGYWQSVNLFTVWLAENQDITEVEQVNEIDVRHYIRYLQTRGKYTACGGDVTACNNFPQNRKDYSKKVSNITINNYIRNIRVFFNWLAENEWIQASPFEKIQELPEQRRPKEYLEDAEVRQIMKALDKEKYHEYRDLIIIMLMLDSGTRLSETLSIEMNEINLLDRSVVLLAEKTKGRKERTVYFSQRTANELKRWIRYKDAMCDSDLLFPIERTGCMMRVSHFESNFRKYMNRVGIKKHVSPHTLRNNFAKRCLLSGMDIYIVSRLLGHSSVKVTEKAYMDVTSKELKKVYIKHSPMNKIFG